MVETQCCWKLGDIEELQASLWRGPFSPPSPSTIQGPALGTVFKGSPLGCSPLRSGLWFWSTAVMWFRRSLKNSGTPSYPEKTREHKNNCFWCPQKDGVSLAAGRLWGGLQHPPGNALMSITACWPVWLLIITSMPNRDTPSACRSDLDNFLITSSLGGWDTPSTFSLWEEQRRVLTANTPDGTILYYVREEGLPWSGPRMTPAWTHCGCWRKWLFCLKREKKERKKESIYKGYS